MPEKLYLGIDAGTGGVRCAASTIDGTIAVSVGEAFSDADAPVLPPGYHEQRPDAWWNALVRCLARLFQQVKPGDIAALSVDSTSGTVLFLDVSGVPLRPAIMYNDTRAGAQAGRANEAAGDFLDRHGYRFNSSFAIAKILWVKENEPEVFDKAAVVCHAADYLAGRLRGDFGFTDTSNALKTGCDLFCAEWPAWIENKLGIPHDRLPRLLTPGQAAGSVSIAAARETGLAASTPIAAGCTDGTAGFLASGAASQGEWSSTLGTTLILRGISAGIVRDPQGRMYCHRHPDGFWLPGAACSIGGGCLPYYFAGRDLAELDRRAEDVRTDIVCYPLVRRGERFPFINSDAQGFFSCEPPDDLQRYRACLEGVAFAERWALEVFGGLGADVSGAVYATGGGARSSLWLRIRASVLQKQIHVPARTGCEFGAAALAASRDAGSVSQACRSMVSIATTTQPDAGLRRYYDDKYSRFRECCKQRGYC